VKTRSERGQAMVFMVLFLVALVGMSTLVLDVGSWFREKRQLQATADAAALAGAQALPGDPGTARTVAVRYAAANGGGVAGADVVITSGSSANDTITVQARNNASGVFSRVFGISFVRIGAVAAARVAVPSQAEFVAPMVVSDKHPLLAGPGCPCFGQETSLPYDQMGAPGGFGMLELDGGSGTVGTSAESAWILKGFDKYLPLGMYNSDPGAKFTSSEVLNALQQRVGTVLLFPVFHVLTGTGSNAQYKIVGWVGFYLDSFDAHGNTATLNGHFTEFIAQGIQSTTGSAPPDFGVRSVQLIH
jgi:Flp pilus assembly protein TadG